ncbi:hypothetical protein SAMN05421781_2447 [Marinococcus luteus]|uniref:Uncharacterized protein n=1 Tax=Marinococcus luteus TaxID=1122204 RepID=A0A1H2WIA5_9BACI|nr:hypothetical protein [Marinococcus luteus]SDW80267.1 hypothetical protein SAMN05421781_2447 [Marinococcus luteus]
MRKNTDMTEVENVIVHKAAEFQGYTVLFSIHGQRFQFLIADGQPLFPLNVLHTFVEQDVCGQCGKKNCSPIWRSISCGGRQDIFKYEGGLVCTN